MKAKGKKPAPSHRQKERGEKKCRRLRKGKKRDDEYISLTWEGKAAQESRAEEDGAKGFKSAKTLAKDILSAKYSGGKKGGGETQAFRNSSGTFIVTGEDEQPQEVKVKPAKPI